MNWIFLCWLVLVSSFGGASAALGDELSTEERWKTWRKDLDHLFEEIEKPAELRAILKAKDIDWKGVRREADKRFSQLAKDFKKRKKNDASEESLEFYNLLVYVVGQLRDSHAHIDAGKGINEACLAKRPKRFDAGIELQLGTHGTVLVANTLAARNSNSPLHGKGVRHTATILETIDGKPAFEYFRHWHGGRSMIVGNGIAPDELVLQDLVELSVGIDSCIARAEAWFGEL